MGNFMVDDAQKAKENRERVKQGYGKEGYDTARNAEVQTTNFSDALPFLSFVPIRARKQQGAYVDD